MVDVRDKQLKILRARKNPPQSNTSGRVKKAETTKDTKVHEGIPDVPSCTFVSFVVDWSGRRFICAISAEQRLPVVHQMLMEESS
jgi:hypothetical protein